MKRPDWIPKWIPNWAIFLAVVWIGWKIFAHTAAAILRVILPRKA